MTTYSDVALAAVGIVLKVERFPLNVGIGLCQGVLPLLSYSHAAGNHKIYYYTNDRGSCKVDFVVDTGEQIIPIEVKAEVNPKAKSLKTYREKYSPEISVRTSMVDYKKEAWLLNLRCDFL